MPSKHELEIRMKMRDEASKRLTGVKNHIRQFADDVRKNWKAIAASILAVGYALSKITQDVISYGVQLDKMSKMTNMSTEEFSKLAYAAEQEHASMEALSKALPVLAKYMGQAKDGLMTYKRAFDAMGVSVADSSGKLRRTYDVFMDIAEYVSTAKDKTEALQRAQEILGRGGKELYNMLLLGESGLKQLGEEAKQAGIVLDKISAEEMKEFDDKMLQLKRSLRGLAIAFTKEMIPVLKEFAGYLTEGVIAMRQLRTVKQVDEFYRLIGALEMTKEKMTKLKKNDFLRKDYYEHNLVLFSEKLTDLAISLQRAGIAFDLVKLKELITDEDLKRLEKMSVELQNITITPPDGKKPGRFKAIMDEFSEFANVQSQVAKLLWDDMAGSFKTFFLDAFHRELKTAEDYFRAFGDVMLNVLANIMGQIMAYFAVVKPLVGMFPGLAPAFGMGAESKVPGAAAGGIIVRGGIVDVGERGRERVYLPAGAQVVPLNQGQSGGGGQTIINNYYITALDAKSFQDKLRSEGSGVIQEINIKAQKYNRGYRDMQRVFA